MTQSVPYRTLNKPLACTLWCLTLFALIPFPNLGCILLGAAANLTANGIALYLLLSRSKADRIHGIVRLLFQVVILVLGVITIARSGITVDGFVHYFSQRMQ